VTVVEPNPNALATLHRRAQEAGVADRISAVQGDADVLSPMDVATTLHRAIPSSSLVAVSGGTHMLPNTHADLLVNQVRMLASRIRAADPHAQQAVGQ